MRIYLIGYMGAGKTTLAKKLANDLSYDFIDLDEIFENQYKIYISDFFTRYGEELFRKIESELLKKTASYDNCVVATGGGAPCFFDNMDWMNNNGVTVFVNVSPKTAADRIFHSKHKRPITDGKTIDELTAFVEKHYAERLPSYEKAQIIVKGENLSKNYLYLRDKILEHE